MKNVILLTIDTLRRDVLGCYGGGNLTPFIDSIQEKCIRFTKAHSTGPYTRAAFPGILTSSYYLDHGGEKILSGKRVLISELLQNAGIATAAFHSNPFMCGDFGWNRGWNMFYDSMEETVDEKVPYVKAREINRKAIEWLSAQRRARPNQPFFLWLHYMDIHEPYVPARVYLDRVDASVRLSEDEMFALFREVLLKRNVADETKVHILKTLYRAHACEIDDGVRELFGLLGPLGVLEQSRIIITADHGDEFGEHGGLSHDGKMYSELIHVPLMLYEPNRSREVVSHTLVSTLDVSPTILHCFEQAPDSAFQGRSLLPLDAYPEQGVFGEAVDKHGSIEKGGEKEVHYYREKDLKIIYRERDDAWELYDLAGDAGETQNIAARSPELEAMQSKVRPRVRRYQR